MVLPDAQFELKHFRFRHTSGFFQTTVFGGVDRNTSVFGCTADGIYDTPAVFPVCEPELNSESWP